MRIERGSGNVFEDLGLPDARMLMAKADLVSCIADILARRGLTQARAAKILGVERPRISALLRGRLGDFSIDHLFRFLNALGCDVEIAVKPRRRATTLPAIRVLKGPLAS